MNHYFAMLRAAACLLLSALTVLAQDTTGAGVLRGVVKDAAGAPAKDVKVCIPVLNRCATTDALGAFSLVDLRADKYTLEITAPNQRALTNKDTEVRAGLETLLEITLPKIENLSDSVTISAPAFIAPEEIKNSGYLVQQREIAKTAGALQDVSRYVQTLPGVAIGSNDFRNDIIVRGGSPLENLFVVDNIEIPNINNFANFAAAGGTVSILDAELIQDVNFLTGGYPAPYINRLSSVLQITQREGNRDKFSGRATVGFAGAGGIAEGPINKGKGSWVVSARRSFLDYFSDDIGIGGVPVNYSFNSKAVYDLNAANRIWLVNFTGIDRIRLGPIEGKPKTDDNRELENFDIRYRGWRSATGLNWQRVFGARGVGLLGFSHSEASVNQQVKDLLQFRLTGTNLDDIIARTPAVYRENSREGETTLKYDLTLYTPVLDKVQLGGSFKLFRIRYDAAQPFGNSDNPFAIRTDANPFTLQRNFTARQTGAYVQASQNIGSRLNFTVGGRYDNYQYISANRFSPRAGVSLRLTDKLSWRGSYGIFYQQPFFLFLSAFPINRQLDPTRATHYVTGLAYQASNSLRMTVELYQKDYRDYPVSLDYPAFSLANAGDTFAVRDLLFPLISAGRGRARGIEFFVEKKFTAKWFGQANLAFSRTRHAGLDGVFRPGSFDYPVIFNAVGGYKFNQKWEFSSRVALLGGRPFTPFNETLSRQQSRGIFDFNRVNGERAPDYFRLDFRVDRTFTLRDKPLIVFAGLQNATNRKNFAQVNWDRRLNQQYLSYQLGIFPLVGLDWRF
ncbi:MAG: TonB-dependent receptor [Acidobacteria bacterium]|nr:TonB-dependent receptor [Acidobacteriota bacterium]